jgi:hypothetical protein
MRNPIAIEIWERTDQEVTRNTKAADGATGQKLNPSP